MPEVDGERFFLVAATYAFAILIMIWQCVFGSYRFCSVILCKVGACLGVGTLVQTFIKFSFLFSEKLVSVDFRNKIYSVILLN